MNPPSNAHCIIEEAHQKACAKGSKTYVHPETGAEIFTRRYLQDRGYCCNQGCFHCPYGELNITIRFKNA